MVRQVSHSRVEHEFPSLYKEEIFVATAFQADSATGFVAGGRLPAEVIIDTLEDYDRRLDSEPNFRGFPR